MLKELLFVPFWWEGVVAEEEGSLSVTRTLTARLVHILTLPYSFMV